MSVEKRMKEVHYKSFVVLVLYMVGVLPLELVLNPGETNIWRYALAIVVLIAISITLALVLKRIGNNSILFDEKTNSVAYSIWLVLVMAFVARFIKMDIYPVQKDTLFGRYFFEQLLSLNRVIIAIVAVLITMFLISSRNRFSLLIEGFAVVICIWLSLLFYTNSVVPYDYHYDAYFYPAYRIASGQTEYIDFFGIYGAYGYLIAPFIQSPSTAVKDFSLCVCLLVFLCMYLLYRMLSNITNNAFCSLLGLFGCGYYLAIFLCRQQGNSYYLQYMPHRVVFPVICMWLVSSYVNCGEKHAKKRFLRWSIYAVTILAIFWNVETGLILLIANTCFFLFDSIVISGHIRMKEILRTLFLCGVIPLFDYVILELITYSRADCIVPVAEIVRPLLSFGQTNSYSLSIPYGMIILFAIAPGIIKTIVECVFEGKKWRLIGSRFYCVILLIGLGVYSLSKAGGGELCSPLQRNSCSLLSNYSFDNTFIK